jgi:hypothetical protein
VATPPPAGGGEFQIEPGNLSATPNLKP